MPATHRVLVVQPNVDTELEWTTGILAQMEEHLALLSRTRDADMVIWPEMPAPFYLTNPAFLHYA